MKLVQSLALVCASVALAGAAAAQDNKPAARQARPSSTPMQGAQGVLPALNTADQEQMIAASLAYYGAYDCEFKQTLSVSRHPTDGYVVVTFSSKAYTMKPVRSHTGALRLEEVGNGPMLMVQIPTKSMLMDTVRGRRIVDACVHEVQVREASVASTDTNALGMNLPGQVDTTTAAKK
jgi:hypothetical protein